MTPIARSQPQQPPPQQPPPPADGAAGADLADEPPTATVERSFTVSACPAGQEAGSED